MIKKFAISTLIIIMSFTAVTGCSFFTKTCKESGCEETEIYKDGYCKYHYEKHLLGDVVDEAEGMIKDFVNGN